MVHETLVEYAWFNSYFPSVTVGTRLWLAFRTVLCLFPAKILFTYFILWVVGRAVNNNKQLPWLILMTIPVLMVCVAIYRNILYYYVVPRLLHNPWSEGGFWNPKRLLANSLDIIFVGAIAVSMKFLRMNWQVRMREKKLLQEKLEAELKFLRTQTNPHFLFNTLNNIYALARKKSDDTADVVMKLSSCYASCCMNRVKSEYLSVLSYG
ncbi:histidine kinase [Paraflavitalea speifideaquila]|uniref:histidine kinase n=1 Tax=Paraflavitalea speifideaquila TaxID=3076558 RepID=UPI0028F0F4F9|nr:histidine kinase [Paraflavitalea speifideiaquila]